MEYSPLNHRYFLLFLIVISLPKLGYSQEKSKATYYGSPDCKGTPTGACGYGEYGRTVNDGDVAAVSRRLYKNGARCSACYQMKCMEAECNEDGVRVVVTDRGASRGGSRNFNWGDPLLDPPMGASRSDDSEFILSEQAYTKMAKSGMEKHLKEYGHVNIEYQRVPCKCPAKNLMLKVQEHSHYPDYLAFVFYYQAASYDITAVEIFEEANLQWRACRRAYGAVWDVSNPPKGDLTIRFFATASLTAKAKWVVVPNVIPLTWMAGAIYDTSIQLS